jgi:hypothetical protein
LYILLTPECPQAVEVVLIDGFMTRSMSLKKSFCPGGWWSSTLVFVVAFPGRGWLYIYACALAAFQTARPMVNTSFSGQFFYLFAS